MKDKTRIQNEVNQLIVQLYRPMLDDAILTFVRYELDRLMVDVSGGAESIELFGLYSIENLVKALRELTWAHDNILEIEAAYQIIRVADAELLGALISIAVEENYSEILAITTRDGVTVESLIFS